LKRDIVNIVDPDTSPHRTLQLAQQYGLHPQFSLSDLIWRIMSGPRPFYIVGHNPNSRDEVISVLNSGANAIEPDVNVYFHNPAQLCISEEPSPIGLPGQRGFGGDDDAPSLELFLNQLHDIAIDRPELALVVFDCKPMVARPWHGITLLNAIRKYLTNDIPLNVIISVSSLSETAIFDNIKTALGPREGLMIDEENDPIAVSNFFFPDVANQCYGNGISILGGPGGLVGPNVRRSMEIACEFQAATDRIRFIYVWTVNSKSEMEEYLRIGVNGIITDDLPNLVNIVNRTPSSFLRLARRSDNPFVPYNFAYGLVIHTGDVQMRGTDANVTFTLTGARGSSSVTVNTELKGRMERNDWNQVTVKSPDLGDLQSITVQRDNQGNAPDWYLDLIIVESFRYGVSKQAIFNRWIDTTSPFTQSLT
jgi:hypothetical protein